MLKIFHCIGSFDENLLAILKGNVCRHFANIQTQPRPQTLVPSFLRKDYLFILLGRYWCACFCLCRKLASFSFNSQVILRSQYPFFYFIRFVISDVVLCRGRIKLFLLLFLLIVQSYIFIGACFFA